MAGIVDDLAKRIAECAGSTRTPAVQAISTSLQEIDCRPSDRGRLGFRRLGVNVASCRHQSLPRTRLKSSAKFDNHSEAMTHKPPRVPDDPVKVLRVGYAIDVLHPLAR